jgi:hypothetical protein
MEEIAWDVIEQVFTQTVRESGISDYCLQQKIFSDIKKELTCQIEESLGRDVERMTCEELKNIIRKAIDRESRSNMSHLQLFEQAITTGFILKMWNL